MDIDYTEVIDFSKLKECIIEKRTTSSYVAEDAGLLIGQISQIIKGSTIPLSGTVAKLCMVLNVPASKIVEFKGIEPNEMQKKWFSKHSVNYKPAEDAVGEVTYAPLWELTEGFLEEVNKDKTEGLKTVNDILDTIEPYRRRNGVENGVKKALEARGIYENYQAKKRKRVEKGLPESTRVKLRNDRSLSLRTIYDICKKLGCSIDWVLSYK